MQRKEGTYFQAPTSFQTEEKKKHKEKKTIKKKKMQRREGAYLFFLAFTWG
jgi:hypothetical protein